MATYLRITAQLPYTTHLPRDVSENTWHFLSANDGHQAPMFTFWAEMLSNFYTNIYSGVRVGHGISRVVDRTICGLSGAVFDPATGDTEPAFARAGLELTGVGDDSLVDLPLEVALCASFQADRTAHPGPVGRRRGRIYLGPLNSYTVEGAAGDGRVYPNPSDTYCQGVTEAMLDLQSHGYAPISGLVNDTGEWSIYSRADHALYPVHSGYVDNEWDTQRRRGQRPTFRRSWVGLH